MHASPEQDALRCPSCAGQCRFDAMSQGLLCASCGASHSINIPDAHDAALEHEFSPDAPPLDPPEITAQQAHNCTACGGTVVFTGASLSEHCPYCDGAVVQALPEAAYGTMALIPFQADRAFARTQALKWIGRRIAAPSDLETKLSEGRLVGLYAPFWTFDSREAVEYWAKYTTGSGKNKRTYNVSGQLETRFDDLLMPASLHVTPLLRDGVLHDFDPANLRPYDAAYLAGFAAERHHQSVADGLRANEADKDLLIRNRIRRHVNKSGVHSIRYQTDTTGIHYRRILLPMWIWHYTHGAQNYRIVISGIDGRAFGERPFSTFKLALLSGAMAAVAVALGLAWGAGGLL